MIKYEATRTFASTETTKFRQTEQEFDTKEEALAYVEADQDDIGYAGGKVITWNVSPNLPGRLPALKYSSCALDVYEYGAWRAVNIF